MMVSLTPGRTFRCMNFIFDYNLIFFPTQVNENDQRHSFANYMMSVKQFTNTYLEGQPIFDSKCQEAGAGPWNLVKADWTGYLNRWGCRW